MAWINTVRNQKATKESGSDEFSKFGNKVAHRLDADDEAGGECE